MRHERERERARAREKEREREIRTWVTCYRDSYDSQNDYLLWISISWVALKWLNNWVNSSYVHNNHIFQYMTYTVKYIHTIHTIHSFLWFLFWSERLFCSPIPWHTCVYLRQELQCYCQPNANTGNSYTIKKDILRVKRNRS